MCAAVVSGEARAGICWELTQELAPRIGVPLPIARAVLEQESSGWPWTLNVQGRGLVFKSYEQANAALGDVLNQAPDIGCYQVNWRWHSHRFTSPANALEPAQNVRAGLTYLAELHAETGSWSAAVGRYHSRNSERAGSYQCLVARRLTTAVECGPAPAPVGRAAPRTRGKPPFGLGAILS